MPYVHFMIYKVSFFSLLCIFSLSLISCDSTIRPISDQDPSYSIYGTLNIGETPNYIRVHDNSSFLTPESTLELDATIFITNLNTNFTTQLRDSVVVFESIYTHNFIYDSQITHGNRYKVLLESESGYRDSLVSITPARTELTLSRDAVECDQLFTVELTNIDLNAGEQLIAEAGIELSNTWYWTNREFVRSYDSENNTLIVGWSPAEVSREIFAGGFGSQFPFCNQFTSDVVRFRYMHIGYMEGGKTNADPLYDPDEGIQLYRKVVLGRYGGEAEVDIIP
ncbi:MAG: hypothetical protein R3283_08720 [Balneolaceae bacterium]|nr:hypothetical protein [Balneolaceae bacterium]